MLSLFAAATAFLSLAAPSMAAASPDLGTLLASQGNLSTFYNLIQTYPEILLQLPSYQGVTILVPDNAAFDRIPYTSLNDAFSHNDSIVITNVLEYHILQGTRVASQLVPGTPVFIPTLLDSPLYTNVTGGQRVMNVEQAGNLVVFVSGMGSRTTLVQSDLLFSGGVVQVIDNLLIPPTNLTDLTEGFNLTALEGALYAADLVEEFSTTPNVTIFAPVNAAFQALGSAITSMTSDELADVMKFHLVPQILYSTDLLNDTIWETAMGSNLTIIHDGNNQYVDSAQILTTDLLIANGVLHIIDNVLNPQAPSAQPNPTLATQVPPFGGASSVNFLPFTSAIPCTVSCPVTTTPEASTATSANHVTSTTTGHLTSTSKGAAPRETGMRVMGMMAAIGGAALVL